MEVLRTHIYTLLKGKCNLLWKEKLLELFSIIFFKYFKTDKKRILFKRHYSLKISQLFNIYAVH